MPSSRGGAATRQRAGQSLEGKCAGEWTRVKHKYWATDGQAGTAVPWDPLNEKRSMREGKQLLIALCCNPNVPPPRFFFQDSGGYIWRVALGRENLTPQPNAHMFPKTILHSFAQFQAFYCQHQLLTICFGQNFWFIVIKLSQNGEFLGFCGPATVGTDILGWFIFGRQTKAPRGVACWGGVWGFNNQKQYLITLQVWAFRIIPPPQPVQMDHLHICKWFVCANAQMDQQFFYKKRKISGKIRGVVQNSFSSAKIVPLSCWWGSHQTPQTYTLVCLPLMLWGHML